MIYINKGKKWSFSNSQGVVCF